MKKYISWYGKLILVSLLLNLIIEAIGRRSLIGAAAYMGRKPLVFLLNVLIIMLPFTLLFLTRRKLFILAFVSCLWLGVGVTNGILLSFRTTPFTAADFRLLKYGLNMITTYLNWFQIIGLAAGLTVLAAGCAALWKIAPIDKDRICLQFSVPLVVVSAGLVIGVTELAMTAGTVATRFGNIGQAYKDYGIPYCFSNSLFNTGISKPDEYNEEALAMIEREELKPENIYKLDENKTPNIIMIQLESFFDPSQWKNNPVKKDPIPFFRYLSYTYPSGFLSVPSVGAGTANTEFEVITGMNLDFFGPGEYPYKTVLKKTSCESTAFDLKNLGYTAHAIHNNEATFYDRNRVFAQLGFDTFTPIEYMYQMERNPIGWCKDKILTDEIVKTLDSTPGSDFIYTISVQGHGAYPDFEYYCEQIGEMDQFIQELIRTLNSRQEPAVVVLFGDHLPGFEWTEEEMKNQTLFQTNYVIWNNLGIEKQKKDVEAYQLSAYVLDLLGIHEGTMMRFHQNYFEDPDPEEEQYLEDMKMLEYDILYGRHEIYDGESPYQATDLKMGVESIVIDQVVYKDSNLLVFGRKFNEYSKICLNDKPVETMYVWPGLLIARDLAEKKYQKSEVTVQQIGRDKVPLGTARYYTRD